MHIQSLYKRTLKAGFTLAELMAVVIIIAILAGIGFGSYQKAVERSKMQEGLQMGHAVMQAVNRYYYDYPDASDRTSPLFSNIDIELSNGSASGRMFTGKNFTVTINKGSVTVARGDGPYFTIYSDAFGSNKNKGDVCGGDADLCKSMGYTSCSGSLCSKPL